MSFTEVTAVVNAVLSMITNAIDTLTSNPFTATLLGLGIVSAVVGTAISIWKKTSSVKGR